MTTTYKTAAIRDVVDAQIVERIATPTIEAAKEALRQWMEKGDTYAIHHNGHMTAILIVCHDGETSDVFARLEQ
jgi:hypothetical protein